MKIAFMVATRGNPRRAAAVIECAKALAGDENEIEYLVGCDADDVETYNFFKTQYPGVTLSVDARPKGVGAVWNRLVERANKADIYCPFPDDSFIATPHWDDGIAFAMSSAFPDNRLGVLAWNDLANPNQCSLPIVTRQWLEMTGPLYDERFPFWFYDTCVNEVWSFIVGRPVVIVRALVIAARKGLTQRMRDLPFWWDFYIHTRAERMAHAEKIRNMLGIDMTDDEMKAVIDMWEKRDAIGRAAIPDVEAHFPARDKPDATYADAVDEARKLMAA